MVSLPDTPEDTPEPEDYTTPPEVSASISDEINPNTKRPLKGSLALGFPNSTPDTDNTVQLSDHDTPNNPGETNPNVKRAVEEMRQGLDANKKFKGLGFLKSTPDPENTVELADDDDEGIQGDTEVMNEDITVAQAQSKDERAKSKLEFSSNSKKHGPDLMDQDVDAHKGKTESVEFSLNSKQNGADLTMEDIDEGKTKGEELRVII